MNKLLLNIIFAIFSTAILLPINLVRAESQIVSSASVGFFPNTLISRDSLGPTDLWEQIRAGFTLPASLSETRVQQEIEWLKRNPNYLVRVTQRAEPYLFYIAEQVRKHGLPAEIALLPIVESAYDPFAYSPGRAAGLWQFIPSTGKHYGLEQNGWHDERRDVLASTQAAIDYLSQAHARFDGDWLLALASYNAGQGRISKAVRRNKKAGRPTDFWSLSLPKETARYVPRLLAISAVIKQPKKYGLSLHPIKSQLKFATVDIGSQLDLAQAANLADISMDELYRFNPQYNRWATPPQGPHRLLLPLANSAQFVESLATLAKTDRLSWHQYVIRSGDTLSEIVRKYGASKKQIKKVNDLKNDSIRLGRTLMIPVASEKSSHYIMSARQRNERLLSARKKGQKAVYYIVKSGDSWWTIARKHSVTTAKLASWNGKAPGDVIRPGQKLVLWSHSDSKSEASFSRNPVLRKVYYQVRSGDNLSDIASRFKVQLNDLIVWNNLDKSRYLKPGQNLRIHVDVTRG